MVQRMGVGMKPKWVEASDENNMLKPVTWDEYVEEGNFRVILHNTYPSKKQIVPSWLREKSITWSITDGSYAVKDWINITNWEFA